LEYLKIDNDYNTNNCCRESDYGLSHNESRGHNQH